MLHLIREEVDIYTLPVPTESSGTEITIGDLHGNAMKLIFMLVKHGIATISEDDYKRLVEIYKTPIDELTNEKLQEFNKILDNMHFSNKSLIRLIGDELADRGYNDYFTLKVLQKLKEHNVHVEILLSNHSVEFIEAYERRKTFSTDRMYDSFVLSMINLNNLIVNGIVSKGEILQIVETAYKPTLRAISYSLSEDQQEITIYSHAGIGLNTIQKLAAKLGVDYNDTTVFELAQTINTINNEFQCYVQDNEVHTLYTAAKMGGVSDHDATFEFIMWNREYTEIDRPSSLRGYKVNFVHGHDSKDPTEGNVYNLDNELGKMDIDFYNKKEYTVLQCPLSPSIQELLFLDQLNQIALKATRLKELGYKEAATEAETLYKNVKNSYVQLKNDGDGQAFKTNCNKAINDARPILEQHRGWKQVLGNLALAVVGLGVGYVAAGLINKAVTGKFLFFKTDTANKVDNLEKTFKSIADSPNPTKKL